MRGGGGHGGRSEVWPGKVASRGVNEHSQFQNAKNRPLLESILTKQPLSDQSLQTKSPNKDKALAGAFSKHCENVY